MKLFYRVLSIDENECSFMVRYWSDEVTELELSQDLPEEHYDPPKRCRTDTHMNVWRPEATPDELHEAIMANAPMQWLELKGKVKNPAVDTTLSQLQSMVGVTKAVPPKPKVVPQPPATFHHPGRNRVEVDITDQLMAEPSDKDQQGRVILTRIWVKTNNGPWTYPTTYTADEVFRIVNPYIRSVYSNCKGIITQPQVYFEASDRFLTRYTMDNITNARAMHKFLKTETPESKALRDLAKSYQEAAGTTYACEWRLTYWMAVEDHPVNNSDDPSFNS